MKKILSAAKLNSPVLIALAILGLSVATVYADNCFTQSYPCDNEGQCNPQGDACEFLICGNNGLQVTVTGHCDNIQSPGYYYCFCN